MRVTPKAQGWGLLRILLIRERSGQASWLASSSTSPNTSSSRSTRPRARSPSRASASSWASASRVESNRGAGSRRRPSTASRQRSGRSRDARAEAASRRSPRSYRAISSDGAPTSASAKPLQSCAILTGGSGGGCAPSPGSNGGVDAPALLSYCAAASAGTWRRKPPAAPIALGGSGCES